MFGAILITYTSSIVYPIKQDIRDLRASQVPRVEHDRAWRYNDQRFSDVQRQIDQQQQMLSQIITPNDIIKRFQERLDRIEERTAKK